MRRMVGGKAVERDAASTEWDGLRPNGAPVRRALSRSAAGSIVCHRCSTSSVVWNVLSRARATFVRRTAEGVRAGPWRAVESDLRRYFRADAVSFLPARPDASSPPQE